MKLQSHRRDYLARHMMLWITHVSTSQDALAFLEPYLDTTERERAARFHFPEDRARFVLGRGLLRTCLAPYLGVAPEAIALDYTTRGQPILAQDTVLQFSITHTQDLVALAVTDGARIGVDIEAVQPHSDLTDLAARILSPTDLARFAALPESEKSIAFHHAWTRKEAYLKARGEGIAERLQQISVSMGPEQIVTLRDDRDESPGEKWRLISLPVPAGYAGALACNDGARALEGTYVTFHRGEPVPDPSSHFDCAGA